MRPLDQIDIEILSLIETDARLSIYELSRRLNYPVSTLRDRLNRMEEEGVILGYQTMIDYKKLGFEIKAVVMVHRHDSVPPLDEMLTEMDDIKEIADVQIVTGDVDEMITIRARNVDHLKDILFTKMRTMGWPARYSSTIILAEKTYPFIRNLIDKPGAPKPE